MVRYQNLMPKPELFRGPLGPGPGMMYPLNPLLKALVVGSVVEREKVSFLRRPYFHDHGFNSNPDQVNRCVLG